MSANNRVNILGDVGLNGSLIMLQNNENFPSNPALGTMVIKEYGLYAYVQVGELQTWYPFNNNKTKAYVHTQSNPSSRWTITHNLNSTEVWYQVYSTSGVPVFASRSDITANSFKLDLVEATTGTVVVVSPDTLDVPYVKSQSFTVGEGTANVTVIDNSGITVNGQQVLTSGTVQPASADLTAIDALSGNSGFLKKTGLNTWALDTNSYLTGNQSISFSGDATGSGTTSVSLTLANSGVSAGTYNSVTVDAKGRVTSGSNVSFATVATSGSYNDLTDKPTTLTVSYNDLTDKPTLFSGSYADLTNKPTLFSGSYADLTNKPTLFSGSYADLTSKPTTISGYGITDAINTSAKGVANGVASLDGSGKVPSSQLPSYVDDIEEYANLESFPATGETGKIYVAKDVNKIHRWTGTTYVEVSSGISSFNELSGKPTTLAGYGITDAQPLDADLTSIAGLSGNSGILKKTAANTWELSNPTTLAGYGITDAQPLDADLTSIAGLSGNSGILKKTAANTWELDTASYAPTSNPTFSGTFTNNASVRSEINALAAFQIDCSLGNYFTKTLTGDATLSFANVPASGVAYSCTLRVEHTSGAIVWPSSIMWPGNLLPSLTPGKVHLFVFITENGGTTWRAAALTNYNS